MMIVSAKVSKRKLLTGVLVAVGVVLLLVFLTGRADANGESTAPDSPESTGEVSTNQQRLAFLQSFGWEVSETPEETQEVRIPETFNEVFTRYNQLQQSQGYDLEPYGGKAVKRYVYRILNHPNGADHFATLLISKDQVIGGDVTGTGHGGSMHGFQMPETGSQPNG